MTDPTPLRPHHDRQYLARRRSQIAELCRNGLLTGTEPVAGDEDVLDQMGHDRDVFFLYVQAWLAREYIAARGCYADPQAREDSGLFLLVMQHALKRYECPHTCEGTVDACDRCEACIGGDHRRKALASMEMASTLALLGAL